MSSVKSAAQCVVYKQERLLVLKVTRYRTCLTVTIGDYGTIRILTRKRQRVWITARLLLPYLIVYGICLGIETHLRDLRMT